MPCPRLWPLWGVILVCLGMYGYILAAGPMYPPPEPSKCCKRADLTKARILITGACGFIGMHLAVAIMQSTQAEVVGLDALNGYYSRDLKAARLRVLRQHRVPVVVGDVCDRDLLVQLFRQHRFTHVAHLAAYAGVRYSEVSPESYERANVRCTLALLEVLRYLDHPPRIVIASSSSVYGNAPVPFRELKTGVARSIYAATKQATESISFIYLEQYGLDIAMLRFFTVYGPYGRPDMAIFAFTHRLLTGQPITLRGGGGMLRDFTYVDDIVAGVLSALRGQCGGGYHVYNLGNNHPVNASAILAALERRLHRKALVRLTKQPLSEVDATWADITLARRHLCWEPRVDLQEGLRRFTDWYLEFNADHSFSPHVMSPPPGKPLVVGTALLAPPRADGPDEERQRHLVRLFQRWRAAVLKVVDLTRTSVVVHHTLTPAHLAEAAATPGPEFLKARLDIFAEEQQLSPEDYTAFLWLDFLMAHPETEWVVVSAPEATLLGDPWAHFALGAPQLALPQRPSSPKAHASPYCLTPAVQAKLPTHAQAKGAAVLRWSSAAMVGHRRRALPVLTAVTDALLAKANAPCAPPPAPCRNCSATFFDAVAASLPSELLAAGQSLLCAAPRPGCLLALP